MEKKRSPVAWICVLVALATGVAVGRYGFPREGGSPGRTAPSAGPHAAQAGAANVPEPARQPERRTVSNPESEQVPPDADLQTAASRDGNLALAEVPSAIRAALRANRGEWSRDLALLARRIAPADRVAAMKFSTQIPQRYVGLEYQRELMKLMAKDDVATALAQANATPSTQDRIALLSSVLEVWSATDAGAALRWLASQPASPYRLQLWRSAIPAVSISAPKDAMEFVETQAPQLIAQCSWSIMMNWASKAPTEAAAKVLELKTGQQRGLLQQVVATWVSLDAGAAEAWVQGLPAGSNRNQGLQGLINGLAQTNPARAMALAVGMPPGQQQQSAVMSVVSQWANQDLPAAVAWMKQLSDGKIKERALSSISYIWAATEPQQAVEYAMSLPSGSQRANVLSGIVNSWAAAEPQAALTWAQSLPPGRDRANALQAAISAMGRIDPAAAIAAMNALPAGSISPYAFSSIVGSLAEVDAGKAVEWVKNLPVGSAQQNAVRQLSYWIGNNADPVLLADVLAGLPAGNGRRDGISALVSSWANHDLQGALDWTLKLSNTQDRQNALRGLSYQWVQNQPKEAMEFFAKLTGEEKGTASSLVSQWASSDPVAAITWVGQQPRDTCQQLLPPALGAWADYEPVEAADYVARLQPGSLQNDSAKAVAQQWARTDPAAAAKWAATFPGETLQSESLRNIMSVWVNDDPAGAQAWVETVPAGKVRDAALNGAVGTLTWNDPVTAIRFSELIQEVASRNSVQENAARSWMRSDAAAASAWVRSSSLPQDVKTRLLAPPKSSP